LISGRTGVWVLVGFLWWYSEARGAGDLRFYAAMQVYAVLILPVLLLLPPRYTRGSDFGMIFGFYGLAKVFETADRRISRSTSTPSAATHGSTGPRAPRESGF
jgi:hypothetical protein